MSGPKNSGGFARWLDERSGLAAWWRGVLSTPYRGGPGWKHTLGAALLLTVAVQLITGALLTFHYLPHPDHAYDSVLYIQKQVAFGNIIRGMHHWGASMTVILLGLHFLQVVIYGAYKKPRELNWWTGLLLSALAVGAAFTGYTLPWDEKGYWGANVAISLLEAVPFVGGAAAEAFRGGPVMGISTLTHPAALHTTVFPALLLAVLIVHGMAFRRLGPTPSWRRTGDENQTAPYSPEQLFRDSLVFFIVFALIFLAALAAAPALTAKADPTTATAEAKPEWFLLRFYFGMRFAEGGSAFVAEMVLPALVVLYFVLLPVIDRRTDTNPAKRWGFLVIPALLVLSIGALTVFALLESPPASGEAAFPSQAGDEEYAWAQGFYVAECARCHGEKGEGADWGPVRFDRDFFAGEDVKEPAQVVLKGRGMMPPFASKLTAEEAGRVLRFIKDKFATD